MATSQDAADCDDAAGDPDFNAVLQLQQFCQHPTLEFGTVPVGSLKTLYLKAENPTLLTQHLAVEKAPVQDGFVLSEDPDLPGAASLNWSSAVLPSGSVRLPVTWQPAAAGPVTKLIVFKLDGKHRLQVKLLGKATVQFKQPKRPTDQALRSSMRVSSSDAFNSTAKAATSKRLTSAAPAAAGAQTAGSQRSQLSSRGTAAGSAGAVKPTASGGTATTGQASFKAPPKRSCMAAASQLRLKPPSGAAAARTAGAGPAATARPASAATNKTMNAAAPAVAARVETRCKASCSSSSCAAGMLLPTSPAAGSRLATEASSPALEGSIKSAGWTGAAGGQSLAKGAINRSGRPASASCATAKVPTTAKKTFRFFHTELWMNKQDRAFSGWLNNLLLPYTPEYLRAASEGDTSAALTDLRLAARVKGAMVACFRSDPEVKDIMMKVEKCVDDGKLRMKPELVMFGDLVQRRQALDVLMSYNPFWLHLGVEVVTQKAFKLQGTDAPLEPGTPGTPGVKRQPGFADSMRSFLLKEVLSDPELAAEIDTGKGAAHFNVQEHQEELGALMLKRFLLLVLLMDRVATHVSGPYRTPLLFKLTGSVKSSKQVVMDFLHGRLFGEGNVSRHLELLGYKLYYTQSPLMEYPFAISNLAVDLRDGLRLIKVAEVLTGDSSLLSQARFPSDRKPMQLYNTNLALSALAAAGVNLAALPTTGGIVRLKPEDIIDGDRERTLALLWAIARTLQLGAVLRVGTLKAEVQRVLARVRQTRSRPLVASAAGHNSKGGQQVPLGVYMNDELLGALMDWVQAVCKAYDVKVQNFTSCFGDGMVLCLLVHYYLPNAIDLGQIYITKQRLDAAGVSNRFDGDMDMLSDSVQSVFDSQSVATGSFAHAGGVLQTAPGPPSVAGSMVAGRAAAEGKGWISRDAGRGVAPSWYAEFDVSSFNAAEDPCLEDSRGIAANFRAVHRAAKALGAVPEMLSSKDFAEHGPDERAVILYVAFLCSRLLECSKDDRAAHIIQRAWRQSKAKSAGMARANLNKWVAAASVIQRCVRNWLFRRHMQQWLSTRAAAAVVLQSCWRGRQARAQLLQQSQQCIVIQRYWRAYLVRREAKRQEAATIIQRFWRALKITQQEAWMRVFLAKCLEACHALKQDRQQQQLAVVKLQATWRMVLAMRRLAGAKAAAVMLQAAWRGRQHRIRYQQQRIAAITLQATWRSRQLRMHFNMMRSAAITLQAAYQGYKVRQAIKQSHAFAVFLQSCCRCRKHRAAFLLKKHAAVQLQAAIRGWQARNRLQRQRGAAVLVQSLYRGRLASRGFQQQRQAAVNIQAYWRGSKTRAAYKQQRVAIPIMQAAWRSYAARRTYQQQRAAAIILQGCWRGACARASIKQQAAAATIIAAAWRQCSAARNYMKQVRAVVHLQALVRLHQAQQEFNTSKSAAVVLQSSWRSRKVRQQIQQWQQAALLIQSCWRAHVQQRMRAEAIAAGVVLQAAVRGHHACSRYRQQQAAAVQLQSWWRSYQARHVLQQHKAAVVIQTHWRRHTSMQQLRTAVQATVVVQSFWRMRLQQLARMEAIVAAVTVQAAVRGQQARRRYSQQQAAALLLQGSWRAQQARQLVRQHRAAQTIQAQWRQHKAQSEFKRAVQAAITIQSNWRSRIQQRLRADATSALVGLQALMRGCQARLQYNQQQEAAILLQNTWRIKQARQLLQQHKAAAKIQAYWRRYTATCRLRSAVHAATVIQSFWRMRTQQHLRVEAVFAANVIQAAVRMHQASISYSSLKAATALLQSSWRGLQCRRSLQQQCKAATVVQSYWRQYKAVCKYRQAVHAVAIIQAQYRRHAAESSYHQLLAAAISLQTAARGKAARVVLQQQRLAALGLQCNWRARVARDLLQQHKSAAVIQAHVRGWLARSAVAKQAAAVTTIRAAWLCHQQRQQYLQARAAATTIQAAVCCLQARQRYQYLRAAAVKLQASWRGLSCRRHYFEQQVAAITIQAAFRSHWQRQQYQRICSAVIAIQAVVRMHQAQQHLQQARAAAVIVQAAWRGCAVRRARAQEASAATQIQAIWRKHAQRQRYTAALQRLTLLQSMWRAHQAAARYQQLRGAAIMLQAAVRGHQAHKTLQLQHLKAAAVVLQSAWRGRSLRKLQAKQAAAALVIQRYARGMHARKRARERREYVRSAKELQKMLLMLHTRSRAATTIQAAWKGWKQQRAFQPVWQQHLLHKSALVLQRAWRCAQARALAVKLHADLPRRVAQRNWLRAIAAVHRALHLRRLQAQRKELAALAMQSAVRGWQVRCVVAKQLAGIRRFQALWRGYKVRQSCGRAGRDARRRIAAASAAVVPPQRRIGVRTREALDVLLASKQCSQVITAVAAIEFSTRYSKACCQLMVDNGGVTALLEFMRSCNRSAPHVQMLNHALACLANICRHADLLHGVQHAPDCIIVLSERLQMFRDTEDIFMSVMGILAALVRREEGALQVALSAPAAVKLWEGILQLLRRKMEMERRYIERLEGKKGSDVTAKQSTSKMVSAAAQCDALERVWKRVEAVAVEHGVEVLHMPPRCQLGAVTASQCVAGEHGEELVPRSASIVVQPNLWQPKNTIVRGALRESVATRTNVLAAVAAGVPVASAAAKGEAVTAAAGSSDAGARRLVGPDVLAAVQHQHADQGCRIDQSHKHNRGHA